MQDISAESGGRRLSVRVGEPFEACRLDPAVMPARVLMHPRLERLASGRLVLTTNIDGDIGGAELVAYASDDAGQTWRDYPDWPKVSGAFAVLGDGEAILSPGNRFHATDEAGVYILPMRRSTDGGESWGELEGARVELPMSMGDAVDWYDPPRWFLERVTHGQTGQAWRNKWQRATPTAAEEAILAQFGRHTTTAWMTQIFPLDGPRALAFVYMTPTWGEAAMTVCLITEDAGRTWKYRSTPGPIDSRLAAHGYLRHAQDGLCEPSCTRLASGDLLLVMRLGSFHPLYTTTSSDEGRTWSPQADQRPGCYYQGWPARPISVYGILPTVLTLADGTIALCTGRPDVTLSLSFDNGIHWPWTHRFIEDTHPDEQSTFNNTMVEIEPGRLLVMYDHGNNSGKVVEYSGPRRIVGHYVDVAVTPIN